jgi:Chaperone of endosialidase
MKPTIILLTTSCLLNSSQAQNVGIGLGTSNPTRAKLEIAGMVGNTTAIFGGDGRGISLISNWPEIGFNAYYNNGARYIGDGYAAIQLFDPDTGTMGIDMHPAGSANSLVSGWVRAMTISNTGNVGILNTTPTASLTVGRGNGYEGTAVFKGFSYSSHFNYSPYENTYIRSGDDGSNIYINQIPGGNVYFGNGSSKLIVNRLNTLPLPSGTLYLESTGWGFFKLIDEFDNHWGNQFEWNTVSDFFLDLEYNGEEKGYFHWVDGEYFNSSDIRLKQEIRPLSDVLERVNQLNPVTYEIATNNPGQKRTIGFIASEVKEIFPELVRTISIPGNDEGTNTEILSLSHTPFGVLAVKALQEQYLQIVELQKEEEDLNKQIAALYITLGLN